MALTGQIFTRALIVGGARAPLRKDSTCRFPHPLVTTKIDILRISYNYNRILFFLISIIFLL